jgi:hypothetical protein
MGYSVSKHSDPARKLYSFNKSLGRLRGAIKSGDDSRHIFKAAEKVRQAALALIKAKRSLLREYPDRDSGGRQLRNLEDEEQRWLAYAAEEIAAEYGNPNR